MTCPHCEARVKGALESLPEVSRAEVSHRKNSAVVYLNSDISNDILRQSVETEGYHVKNIH